MSAWHGRKTTELSPLIANNAVRQQDGNNGCCAVRKWSLFYFFCFLSGQYVNVDNREERSIKRKCVSVAGLILFFGQLFLHLSHVGIAMVVEGYRIGNVSITATENYYETIQCILPQEHWKFSSAITIGTVAAFLSYLLFVLVLLPVDASICCCNCEHSRSEAGIHCNAHRKAFQNGGLSPFDTSTNLTAKETVIFYCNYVVMHVFVIVSFGCFFGFAIGIYCFKNERGQILYNLSSSCWINILNLARIFLYLSSLFCVIQRCFIFSKMVNKVNFKLNRLAVDFDQVDFPEQNHNIQVRNDAGISRLIQSNDKDNVDRGRYFWLQKMDQEFIKQVKPTLILFGWWFIFHWVLYTLTTVLLSASMIEYITKLAQYNIHTKESFIKGIEPMYFLFIVPITLIHLYLVFNPLWCAVSIANARTNLINTVSKKRWANIPLSIQSNFIHYLTSENFIFRACVYDVNVPVDMKWVYLTILLIIISVALI